MAGVADEYGDANPQSRSGSATGTAHGYGVDWFGEDAAEAASTAVIGLVPRDDEFFPGVFSHAAEKTESDSYDRFARGCLTGGLPPI